MDLALAIAASGITAQQAGMDTIAENLANANTPGYIQESPTLLASPGQTPLGVGFGVTTLNATQAYDALLETSANQASANQAQSSALQQVLSGVETNFPVSTTSGISADLSAFWNSWDAVAQNPSSPGDRSAVVNMAQNLVTDFHSASAQIATSSTNAQTQLGDLVSQDNSLLTQMAKLNTQIVTVTAGGGSPNALVDQQAQLSSQLAQDFGAVSTKQPDGTTTVTIGGVSVVAGAVAQQLQVSGTSPSLSITTQSAGTTVPVTSGSAAGTLAAVNQYLPGFQSQLDAVANNLESTVNNQLAQGYTASGTSGASIPLFTGTGAAGLSLNATVVNDPTQLAAASSATNGANDGGNAQAMASLADSTTGPDAGYQSFVQNMGSQISAITAQVQTQTAVANSAYANLEAVSGVNTNSQMVQMLNFQQAYQASAKVINSVDTVMQSLLQAT